ncbi:MAG: cytochrome c oxidase assembly protein [Actinomycetota bacterium]|jgi:putative copper resistance protein D|nr:cytochrome c oxidase assembly protein [Actinomycetota bacterium]
MVPANVLSPPVRLHTLLLGFQTDWLSLVVLVTEIGAAAWYLVSVRRLAVRGRRWSRWRSASFVSGIAVVFVATGSGLAAYDDSVFEMHVIQHLLLMNFAPVLLALSAPITLALQASNRGTQRWLLRVLHHPVVAVVTNPFVVIFLYSGTMIAYFLSPFYQFSLEHPLLHDYTHLHFLVSGCLYWWLVVGLDPGRWRLTFPMKLGLLVVEIPVGTVLGLTLTQSRVSVAPLFHTVTDTHAGGSIAWVVSEGFTLIAITIVLIQWMRADQREAIQADRAEDRALARARAGASGGSVEPADTPRPAPAGAPDDGGVDVGGGGGRGRQGLAPTAPEATRVVVRDGRLVPADHATRATRDR